MNSEMALIWLMRENRFVVKGLHTTQTERKNYWMENDRKFIQMTVNNKLKSTSGCFKRLTNLSRMLITINYGENVCQCVFG